MAEKGKFFHIKLDGNDPRVKKRAQEILEKYMETMVEIHKEQRKKEKKDEAEFRKKYPGGFILGTRVA